MLEFLGYVIAYFVMVGLVGAGAIRYLVNKGKKATSKKASLTSLERRRHNTPDDVDAADVGCFIGILAGIFWPATLGIVFATIAWKLVRVFVPEGK